MLKKTRHISVTVLLCTALLSACGFHLQGSLPLAPPLKKLYLQTPDPYGFLVRNLRQYLKMSGVELASEPSAATATLVINTDNNSQKLISVSATQQTRQYNLYVNVSFDILDSKGRVILPIQNLSEVRTITVQSNQILGSSNEANMFYQQMRRSLAYAIMNRIASKDVTNLINSAYQTQESK